MSQTVKGGVWTNIEDEILKASISKYGLNQWARVSSLLARKSAKQCKARWESWLDPSIRKTEWSKEEDEKLLHLAKLMPTQWRTIAPIVGRTPQMCLERYQKLLDEAEQRESSEMGLTGVGDEAAAPSANDVRKLRAGELDPEPETRPARPDTIDMDEDEKDMLSEARARLANTQGKKAKRKARERQLEQSRRVAALQKRRELKMSGINIKIKTAKKGEMDYNADIPFERKPAEGFYDVSEETVLNDKEREEFDPRKQQLAIKRKGDPQEDEMDDRKRRKGGQNPQAASLAAAMKAGQAQKLREAEQQSKRRGLVLPAPQVSEAELDDIVKMGLGGSKASRAAIDGDNDATRGLISEYNGSMVGATPLRTPMAPKEADRIANELKNIRALNETQSALLGGENNALIEGSGSTGFASATPSRQVHATPNPMATPRQTNGMGPPGSQRGPGATPMRTPRDNFSLNKEGDMQLVSQTPRDIRIREKGMRQSLLDKLAALPRPKETDFELELPEEQMEDAPLADSKEDAALRDAREKAQRDAAERADFLLQTQVIQRRLPRPAVVNVGAMMKSAQQIEDPVRRQVAIETASLIANDATKFSGSKVIGNAKSVRPSPATDLSNARALVAAETASESATRERVNFLAAWDSLHHNTADHTTTDLPGLQGYPTDPTDTHQLLTESFTNIQDSIMSLAQKGSLLEEKLKKVHGGYLNRNKTLRQKIGEAAEALAKTRIDLGVCKGARGDEEGAIGRRLEALREEVAFVRRRERECQEEYRGMREEVDGLPVVANGVH